MPSPPATRAPDRSRSRTRAIDWRGSAMSAEARADAPMAIVPSWIEVHCRIPDGFRRGRPFRLYDGQLRCFRNFYLVRGTAEFDPLNPIYSTAFRYRRALDIGPQGI